MEKTTNFLVSISIRFLFRFGFYHFSNKDYNFSIDKLRSYNCISLQSQMQLSSSLPVMVGRIEHDLVRAFFENSNKHLMFLNHMWILKFNWYVTERDGNRIKKSVGKNVN